MKHILQFAFKGEKRASSLLQKMLMLVLVVSFAISANAATYGYLEFTSTTGSKTAFSVTNLTLTVDGDNLHLTNADGTVDMILLGLASMQFTTTNTATALENILNADAEIQVSTITGVSLGTYPSLLEASQGLQPGVYVISNGTHSQSVVIK